MTGAPERIDYATAEAAAEALAERVATELAAAIEARGGAVLAVPGGTTPRRFLERLGAAALDWPTVTVVPTDERVVPPDDERANQRLVRETLLAGRAGTATFLSLHGAPPADAGGPPAVAARLAPRLPLDVAVLGIGRDGHTASLFPGSPDLAAALAPDAPAVLPVEAPGAPEPRVTLSAAVLAGARSVHLLIERAEKGAALESALEDGPVEEAPVRAVLRRAGPTTIHVAP